MCAVEVPRTGRGTVSKIWAISEITNGVAGCAADGGAGGFHAAEWHIDPRKIGVLGFFGRWASGGGVEHAFQAALLPGRRCGRQRKLPPGFRGGSLSGSSAEEYLQSFCVELIRSCYPRHAADFYPAGGRRPG